MALFDMDGVFTHGDTMFELLRSQLVRSPLKIVRALPFLFRSAFGDRPTKTKANGRLMEIAVADLTQSQYTALVETTARRLAASKKFVQPDAVVEVKKHQANGKVLIITGSERRMARAYLTNLGLTDVDIESSELTFSGSGAKLTAHLIGPAKVKRLKELAIPFESLPFYTDSRADLPVARLTAHTTLVNPNAKTRDAFEREIPNLTVVRWEAK